MNYREKPELIDRLAAEYVLGTLSGGARRRFATWLAGNAALRANVAHWEARLSPLTAVVAPVQPPERVWQGIAAAIKPQASASTNRVSIWDSLSFWRGLGLTTSGLAAALAVFVGVRPPDVVERVRVVERTVETPVRVSDGANPWQPSYVATLTDRDGKTMLMIYVGRNSDELWVKYEADSMPKDASLELWGLDAAGQPRSLGLIKNNGNNMLKLPAMADRSVAPFKKLAVSMEPMGGSTKGVPTGPVMYQGDWHAFW